MFVLLLVSLFLSAETNKTTSAACLVIKKHEVLPYWETSDDYKAPSNNAK